MTPAGAVLARALKTTTKQMTARMTFMMTPAEMMSIRWPTVLFLNERGSSSLPSLASSPSPSPTILHVAAERERAELVGRLAPLELAAGHGRAEADAERLDVDVAPLGGEEVAELVDEDDEAEAEARP